MENIIKDASEILWNVYDWFLINLTNKIKSVCKGCLREYHSCSEWVEYIHMVLAGGPLHGVLTSKEQVNVIKGGVRVKVI